MNIFSDLLQRKSKPKTIEFDFMSFKQSNYEPVEAPLKKTLISSFSNDSFGNFNVREHYRMLKE